MDHSIASDLELSKTKQSNLARAYSSLNAQASSFIALGLQWKDLEDHLAETRVKIQTRFDELQTREAELAEQERKLDSLEQDKTRELEQGNHHLQSIKILIAENSEELCVKEKRFEEVERLVREKERVLKEKSEKLGFLERRIKDKCREVEVQEREANRLSGALSRCNSDVRMRKRECVLKEEEVKNAERAIEKCNKELSVKWEEMEGIQRSILAYSERIREKERVISEIEMKVEEFGVLKKAMEEWCCGIEVKKRELEDWVEKVEKREREFEVRVEEVDLIGKMVNECVDVAQLKIERDCRALEELRQENERHFELLEKSAQERAHELEMKEKRLEEKEKELELKQEQLDSVTKAIGEKMKLKETANTAHPAVKFQQLLHNPANIVALSSTASNVRRLQLIMSVHLKRIDLMSKDISVVLQASADPAGLGLDAMQGFYPTNSTVDNREVDSNLRVRSCIVLLQELQRFSPQINAQVREKAMKLAAEWKAKLTVTAENRLELLGFWRLVSTYGLTSMYDAKELCSLLSIVVQPGQETELLQALDVSNMAYAPSLPVRVEETESSVAKCAAPSSSSNLQLSTTREETNFQGFIAERLNKNNLAQENMLATLQVSSDPGQIVLEMMQSSFGQFWREGGFCSEVNVMKGYIYLLETLMRVSKHIGPCVKENARKLAVQWKARMQADAGNLLEILLYLQFVATYELLSTINGSGIVNLLGVISQHRQALELCQQVGIADKIPGFIQSLIERKQRIYAVRCICIFKLFDKFPAVQLLKDHVFEARKFASQICMNKLSCGDMEKVLDGLIGDLRAVHQCIKDYNLQTEYPFADIEVQIVQLGRLKEHYFSLAPSHASTVDQASLASTVDQQDQRKRKRPDTSTSAPFFQPQQQLEQSNHQTAVSTVIRPIPCAFPTSTSRYSGSSSAFRSYANYRLPGQFGTAATDRANGANSEGGMIPSLKGQYLPNSTHPLPVHSADRHRSLFILD